MNEWKKKPLLDLTFCISFVREILLLSEKSRNLKRMSGNRLGASVNSQLPQVNETVEVSFIPRELFIRIFRPSKPSFIKCLHKPPHIKPLTEALANTEKRLPIGSKNL